MPASSIRAYRTSRFSRCSFSQSDARRAFLQLQEQEAERVSKRARHQPDPLPPEEGDADSPHPLLDTFQLSIRNDGVLKMTNFTPSEIVRIWGRVSGFMSKRWNLVWGNKCHLPPVDVLFMVLSVLKNCGRWDVLGNSFGIKPRTFEKMVLRFLSLLSPHLFKLYVVNAEREYTMKKVTLAGHAFSHYPAARYAVDVTFQQSDMPSGTQQERVGYYSAKHKLHGFKTEVSVISTGLAIGCSHHYHDAVAAISIFRSNVDFHVAASAKRNEEDSMPDDGPLLAE